MGPQGNRLSCRDQEGRRGSEEAVPGPSVFPSRDPGVSGDFWGSLRGTDTPMHLLETPTGSTHSFSRALRPPERLERHLRGTLGSSLRSPAEGEGNKGFPPPPRERSRAEGLLFLHGLESNPGSSLQTEEEAGLP